MTSENKSVERPVGGNYGTWLKNDTTVLSTPLLFRPVYIIILHEILKFIEHFFKSGTPIGRPGHAFYIAGDQGIGKTSLMLILMSILSLRSIDFHYEKASRMERDKISDPHKSAKNLQKKDDTLPMTNRFPSLFRCKDPPPEKQPQPSTTQTQAQASSSRAFFEPSLSYLSSPDVLAGGRCRRNGRVHTNRPVHCPLPEDMQLRKRPGNPPSIEMDKDEIAGRLPRAFWQRN
ncbi:hypothetical protein BLNAU_24087 [Blattamonas nauphoetae]|uniref:Uncharacterized protein n=1 Tax=Blattamonas nauphoetae TaxID=2049346 RepID=A0ABQ9WNF4_9EUKA|nr:hypothetical protein BLNAU_24087 [Blattamonas nauphoetae]